MASLTAALLLFAATCAGQDSLIYTPVGSSEVPGALYPAVIPPTQNSVDALLADNAGGLYYAACGGAVVRYIYPDLRTSALIAGACYPPPGRPLGDGGPATAALLRGVQALALNGSGLFIGETASRGLRFVSFATGVISSIGGPWTTAACLAWLAAPSPFAGALAVGSRVDFRAWAFFPQNGSAAPLAGSGVAPSAGNYNANPVDAAAATLAPRACAGAPPNSLWPGALILADANAGVIRARLANGSVMTIVGAGFMASGSPVGTFTGSMGKPAKA